jgi:asparagine synthase (glutamine-hydrolysing)
MCGIAGYAGWARTPEGSEHDLRAMCGAIRHRGPDDEGHLVAPGVALGMRRLSIIDVAGGTQPIANEDGTVHVVFNGEIYNHRELHAELERRGHHLVTRSDTETLVHLYEEHGARLVHHLRGMFGFAIWDARRQSLLLARDRVGIKPLYYWETPDGVAFASEVRSLLTLDRFPRELDRRAIAEYLSLGYVPEPLCVFAGVRKLPPGHTLWWDRERGVRVERYWTPVRAEQRISERDAVAEVRRLLAESVHYHLESDVPLGAFLSGGIDSSSVVAEMARQMDRPVQTFSIGFEEPEFNEAPHAAAVAKAIGTDHTELIVRPDADALIEEVIRAFDEPFADSSALPTFLVSQLARRHVTVALSGDGGDELFGGYRRYLELLRRRELGAPLRAAIGGAARLLPHGALGRNRLVDLSRTLRGRYAATVASPLATSEGGVALSELVGSHTLDDIFGPLFDGVADRDFATQMMLVDLQSYLPGDILTKVDRMSMAVSLEARVPLLDHVVVEFAASLPSSLKMRDGTGKWIFREAIRELVPRSVLEKPKQGFGVPLRRWFREDLRHRVDALRRPDSPIYEFVDRDAVGRVAAEHGSGRRDHSGMLWRLLVLDVWLTGLEAGATAKAPSFGEASGVAPVGGATFATGSAGV